MEISRRNFFCACVVVLALATPALNAPRSKSRKRSEGQPSVKFDQQQSGDYNIQLHLKDFHIVAVLGDGSWGSYGDYDYNYDYSDLTIKPIIPITTAHPHESSSSEAQDMEEGETPKPNTSPYPILSASTTSQSSEQPSSTAPESSEQPSSTTPELSEQPSSTTPESSEQPSSTTPESSEQPSSTTPESSEQPSSTTAAVQSSSAGSEVKVATTDEPIGGSSESLTQSTTPSTSKPEATKGPKREQAVQIISENASAQPEEILDKKTEPSVINTSLPSSSERLPLGEIMHYRKCADGYARDKQGRCRKIRRTPQIPFGITRFASNLASRFRKATAGGSAS